MSTPGQAPSMPQGPGFITVILDIPFSLAIPNGQYNVFDPVKGRSLLHHSIRIVPSHVCLSADGSCFKQNQTSICCLRLRRVRTED